MTSNLKLSKLQQIQKDLKVIYSSCQNMGILSPMSFYEQHTNTLHLCKSSNKDNKIEQQTLKEVRLGSLCAKKPQHNSCSPQIEASRKLANINIGLSPLLLMKVRYGDKKSQFKVTRQETSQLYYESNYGQTKTVQLDSTDVEYMMNKVYQLKRPQAQLKKCPRQYIILEVLEGNQKRIYSSCFKHDKKDSKALVRLAKIMSIFPQIEN